MSSTEHQSRALYVPERLTYGGCGYIKFQPFPRFNVAAVRLKLALYGDIQTFVKQTHKHVVKQTHGD
jgi:hypothetical protein